MYDVTVRASDGKLHADRTVKVTVKNVNEEPEIMKVGVSVSGMASVMHAEDAGREVATYMASGPPQGASVTWSLSGDDAGDFMISGGVLSFQSDPNYEMPADSGTDNMYMVTVNASYMAGGTTYMDDMEVMVSVTNVDEMGTVSVMPTAARVGTELTASLRDPDGGVTGTIWNWWIDDDMDGGFTEQVAGADSAMYTPTMAKYLKAKAEYDDTEGMGKEAVSDPIMVMAALSTDATLSALSLWDGATEVDISPAFPRPPTTCTPRWWTTP